MINANGQLSAQQMMLEHEQNMSAVDAINAAEQDIRQHGLAVEQNNLQKQAEIVQSALDAAQQQRVQLQLQQPPTGEV
jgi:hypothetical protein